MVYEAPAVATVTEIGAPLIGISAMGVPQLVAVVVS